jgi:hypothetical protein
MRAIAGETKEASASRDIEPASLPRIGRCRKRIPGCSQEGGRSRFGVSVAAALDIHVRLPRQGFRPSSVLPFADAGTSLAAAGANEVEMNTSVSRAPGAVAALVAFGWVTQARAQPAPLVARPSPRPVAAETTSPPNMTLLGTGIATFVVGYGPAVAVGVTSDHDGDGYLLIPVAGPWLDLGNRECDGPTIVAPDGPYELETGRICGTSTFEDAALIASGVLQGFGALQIMGAFFVSQKRMPSVLEAPRMPPFAIVPTVFGRHGMGAMARGQF